ncbi:MAG TPA: CusA/CzcA family heavy metal efflux RND transporter [Syntrophorhabdaceae bacterium]|jgi:cobalt-zinc-cadmium resistance protein CzcA
MQKIIDLVLKQRLLILLGVAVLVGTGLYCYKTISIDAFPDVTNIQVQIISQTPGMSPLETEKFVTAPIELQMSGLTGLKETRSISKYGLSLVTLIFEDSVNVYFARQLVLERMIEVREKLPSGVEPTFGPISTGLGEIFQYTLEGKGKSRMELRTLQDWVVKKILKSVPGVIEVNSHGGDVKEYQVIVSPEQLIKYNLSLRQIFEAVARNNANASGAYMNIGGERYVIRGLGLLKNLEDIGNIVVASSRGTPIFLRDIAELKLGPAFSPGAAVKNGEEAAAGIVLLVKGGNSMVVIQKIKEKIRELQKALPENVRLVPFYDRSDLVKKVLSTISRALAEGSILVIIVLFVFLGSVRTALVVTFSLPLTVLLTFIIMRVSGLTANLMSLGGLAIAIGMIVDGAVVIAENVYRQLSERKGESRLHIVAEASKEVIRPVFFGILVITIVFLPLFSLTDVEGKMFIPLALTVVIALVSSLVVSFLFVPVFALLILKPGQEKDTRLLAWIKKRFRPLLEVALLNRKKIAVAACAALALSLCLLPFIGREFMPTLQEGSLVIQPIRFPSVSLEESIEIEKRFHRILFSFPEVESVVSKIGGSGIATDPQGPEISDPIITLKPRSKWKTAKTQEGLIAKMRERLESSMPGVGFNFTQPIALRVDELISGVKSQIAIKIYGDDLDVLKEKAEEIAKIMSAVRGTADLRIEQVSGQPYLNIDFDRKATARYGINISDVQEIIETAVRGGRPTELLEGDRRFAVRIRFPEEKRNNAEAIGKLLVPVQEGRGVPLNLLADLSLIEGPNQISRENGQRRIVIECNLRDRDMGSFVEEAQEKIAARVQLPVGYTLKWGGQFENQQRAMKRLVIIVPITLLLMFLLLYFTFNSVRNALLIILNIPFALIGGIVALFLSGQYLSVPASVGFIALFGVAALNGIVLVSCLNQLRREGMALEAAVRKGTELRLRPVLMTASVTLLGLVPLLLSTGIGSEIQKPLAVVVVGGLITSTLLTIVVLPTFYKWFEEGQEDKESREHEDV